MKPPSESLHSVYLHGMQAKRFRVCFTIEQPRMLSYLLHHSLLHQGFMQFLLRRLHHRLSTFGLSQSLRKASMSGLCMLS
jgi:hypothetical protein